MLKSVMESWTARARTPFKFARRDVATEKFTQAASASVHSLAVTVCHFELARAAQHACPSYRPTVQPYRTRRAAVLARAAAAAVHAAVS